MQGSSDVTHLAALESVHTLVHGYCFNEEASQFVDFYSYELKMPYDTTSHRIAMNYILAHDGCCI